MTQYDIDLRDYWRIIKKRKSVIIFSVATMVIFSFIFARYQKSRAVSMYSSTATIRIDKMLNLREYYVPYSYPSTDDIATEVKTITSFSVMSEVARRMGEIPDSLKDNEIIADSKLSATVNSLTARIQPERFEFTNIITITAFGYDPVKARDFAQTTAEAYKDGRRENLNRQIDSSIAFIRGQIRDTEDSLHLAQQEFQRYSTRNESLLPYYNAGGVSNDLVDLSRRRNALEEKLNAIRLMSEILKKEGRIENAVLMSAFAEGEGTVFKQKYDDLLKYYQQREELLRYLTPEHPQVKEVNTNIAAANRLLLSQLEGNLKVHTDQAKELDASIGDLRKQYMEAGQKKYEIQQLDSRISDLQAQYTEYMKQLQSLQIKKSENIDEVTITKPAVFNPQPVNATSSTGTVVFIGLLIGLMIGLVFGFVFEAFDTSIGTIEDVESYLGVPVIGMIPQIEMNDLKGDPAYSRRKTDGSEPRVSEDQARLIIHYAPKSSLAEAYRSLRTNIQFISFEREAKVLLFSSSSPREGKTTTIVNLALTMAQSGNRVLLVDADMRKPKVDRIFGLERERGLSEIILGNHPWRSCVKTVTDIITGELGMTDIILTPGIDNLHIITCGAVPPNPSELLNSESMDHFLKEARAEYDIVLFDCSPVLPTTDTAVLGRKTDGVVFVYAFGKVSRGSLKRAKAQLDNVKVRVAGVVLNGIRSDSTIDFHDYKYRKYYYASDEEAVESKNPVVKIRKFFDDLIHKA
jgi:polysaccharide biosynthesis transport protein